MLIEDLLEIVKAELPESKDLITADTNFRQLEEWDSLTGMSIVVLLEENYDVPISDKAFKSFATFSDIFNYIKEQKGI